MTADANQGPYDVAFVTCKAYDLDAAIADFAPVLSPSGAVLPVLTGINHIARLTDRFGADRVLGGVTFFSVVRTPEGDVMVPGHGRGRTSFGELTGEHSARCEGIHAAFTAGGVPSTISAHIVTGMWEKFSAFAAAAAIAVLTRARAGERRATSRSGFCRRGSRRMRSGHDRRGMTSSARSAITKKVHSWAMRGHGFVTVTGVGSKGGMG